MAPDIVTQDLIIDETTELQDDNVNHWLHRTTTQLCNTSWASIVRAG